MALSFVNAFLEWAHDVLPDCHAGIPLDHEAHYIRRLFFRGPGFLMKWLSLFLQYTSKNTLKFQDVIQQDTFFATYPFVKHVDLRQVGLTMSNKKA